MPLLCYLQVKKELQVRLSEETCDWHCNDQKNLRWSINVNEKLEDTPIKCNSVVTKQAWEHYAQWMMEEGMN